MLWSAAGRADFTVAIDSNGVLEGAVVVARAMDGNAALVVAPERLTMAQVNRQFDPFILPVPMNVPVEFPNRDDTAHHVYSFSPIGSFELPLYKGDSPRPITFTRPGVVPLGCNIHDWMIGYIYVVDSPYYTQLLDGSAVFDDLSPGPYEISIWHPAIDGPKPPTWPVSVNAGHTSQTFPLNFPFVAVTQPEPPAQRFDEQADY
jgi:plastocyanin